MRRILMAAAALALCSGAAMAGDDDVMSGFYGNTAISTGGMFEAHTHYKADHTFDLSATGMGQSFNGKGTWALDGKGNICRTFETAPMGMPNPNCGPIAAHKVGDSWSVTANGSTRTLKLVAGIQ
jgi:opacity protein-like surface antigen